jgi:hypothetical protein
MGAWRLQVIDGVGAGPVVRRKSDKSSLERRAASVKGDSQAAMCNAMTEVATCTGRTGVKWWIRRAHLLRTRLGQGAIGSKRTLIS